MCAYRNIYKGKQLCYNLDTFQKQLRAFPLFSTERQGLKLARFQENEAVDSLDRQTPGREVGLGSLPSAGGRTGMY